MNFCLKLIDANVFNRWQTERHYLKRPIIRSKLLAYGLFIDEELVGGLLWATPHFTKKRNLFGYPNTSDKWEVLMLARFYLEDGCGIIASQALAESLGRGKTNRGSTENTSSTCYEESHELDNSADAVNLLSTFLSSFFESLCKSVYYWVRKKSECANQMQNITTDQREPLISRFVATMPIFPYPQNHSNGNFPGNMTYVTSFIILV